MYPITFDTDGLLRFSREVDAERQAQLAKFGEQRHPDIDPRDIPECTHPYYAQRADIWRQVNSERADAAETAGRCGGCPEGPHPHTAWDGILLEEVYEALAESDPAKLRAELVQVAAVCAAWIWDLDNRAAEQLGACGCGDPATPNVIHRPGAPCYVDEVTHIVADDSNDPEHVDDCPGCEAGIEHDEHCPTPETHNWGCGCASDQHPGARQYRANVLRDAAEAVLELIGTEARLPQTISGVYRAEALLRRLADEAAR